MLLSIVNVDKCGNCLRFYREAFRKIMMNLENLTKKFSKTVLKDITVSFPENQISIIVGINGSGKTTLLNCIVGLTDLTSGKITIDSFLNNTEEFKSQLFYLPSDFYLPNFMTGKEYLCFVLSRYRHSNKDRIHDFLKIFDLYSSRDNLLETYSFGMKKKIQIIAAALSNTTYILGDEIFNGLDFETTLITLELFKKLSSKTGIVIVSHNKAIIERFPENILLMSNGKLEHFLGSPSDLEKEILSTEIVDEKIKFIQSYCSIS